MKSYKPTCPFCGSQDLCADFVDIEVGMEQVTPYQCMECHAEQMNPYLEDDKNASEEEKQARWWKGPEQQQTEAS